jgi:hypothetical protein
MSFWKSAKARQVFRALERIGWQTVHQSGFHKSLNIKQAASLITYGLFMIVMKLALGCLLVLPSTLD